MLEQQDRLRFDRGAVAWVRSALAQDDTVLVPVTADIATRAGGLHTVLSDPADALIYASAVESRAPLVTRDRRITEHDPARVIW